jgi:hypothetical protein
MQHTLKQCGGAHCRCMNLGGTCSNFHYADCESRPKNENEGNQKLVTDLEDLLLEARTGEFGDFTNDKYPAPKVALVGKLETLKQNVINGNYD